jgi:hypothetical protein
MLQLRKKVDPQIQNEPSSPAETLWMLQFKKTWKLKMSHLLLQKLFRMLEDAPIQNEPSSPTGSIEEADATQGAKDHPISNKQVKTAEEEKIKK